jgi:hypothetical protein
MELRFRCATQDWRGGDTAYPSKLEKGASYPGLEIIANLVTVLEVGPAVSLFAAGQIAGARLRDYANFIAARSVGGL